MRDGFKNSLEQGTFVYLLGTAISNCSSFPCVYRDNQFKEAHAFIGYQNDTPAAVIFQATNLLKRLVGRQGEKEYLRLQLAGVLDDDLSVESTQWCQTVGLLIFYCNLGGILVLCVYLIGFAPLFLNQIS